MSYFYSLLTRLFTSSKDEEPFEIISIDKILPPDDTCDSNINLVDVTNNNAEAMENQQAVTISQKDLQELHNTINTQQQLIDKLMKENNDNKYRYSIMVNTIYSNYEHNTGKLSDE